MCIFSSSCLKTNLAGKDRNALLKYISKIVNSGTGEDIFKCDICGKTGARKDNVHNHVENRHFPGIFNYKCKLCDKLMPTKKALNNHIFRNHKDGEKGPIVIHTKYVDN